LNYETWLSAVLIAAFSTRFTLEVQKMKDEIFNLYNERDT